jgi:uncharacterized protein (TIGR02996 family)
MVDAEASFIEAVKASPDDTGTMLVYADWLEERGDPRADFLRQFVALVQRLPTDPAFATEWGQLRQMQATMDAAWLADMGLGLGEPLLADLEETVTRQNQHSKYDKTQSWYHSLATLSVGGLLDVEYRGESYLNFYPDDGVSILTELLRRLASPELAPRLRSFTFNTPGSWAGNGVCNYDIDPLLESDQTYPNLLVLSLDQGEGEHGYKILNSDRWGDYFDAGNVLAMMLERAPRLDYLLSPVPPNAEFFQGKPYPLRHLNVDAGLDHQSFVRNLADSSRFPQLEELVFTDFCHPHTDDWREHTTPFEDYVQFFRSKTAARLKTITLQQVDLAPDRIQDLLRIRKAGVTISRHTLPSQF